MEKLSEYLKYHQHYTFYRTTESLTIRVMVSLKKIEHRNAYLHARNTN